MLQGEKNKVNTNPASPIPTQMPSNSGRLNSSIGNYKSPLRKNESRDLSANPQPRISTCRQCSQTCKTYEELRNHVFRVHNKVIGLIPKSNYQLVSAPIIQSNNRTSQDDRIIPTTNSTSNNTINHSFGEENAFYCSPCNRTFQDLKGLRSHITRIHNGDHAGCSHKYDGTKITEKKF